MRKHPRGFTLIELLVVVAIIGLLSSIVLASLNVARVKARDAERKSQADAFRTALELYYTKNGNYPCAYGAGSFYGACGIQVAAFTSTSNAGQLLINDGDISAIPSDPLYPAGTAGTAQDCNITGTGYCYCSNGTDSYVLTVNTEDDKGGSDRCYIDVGPNAATYCAGHQDPPGSGDSGTWATQDCSQRF